MNQPTASDLTVDQPQTAAGLVSQRKTLWRRSRPRLVPKLSLAAWWLLGGDLLYWFGIGLFIPYFAVYLHQVRGIDMSISGLIVAAGFGVGFVSAPLAGVLSDRFHPRLTLTVALCLAIAGALLLPLVQTPWQALIAAILLLGGGQSMVTPTAATLLAAVSTVEQRTGAFTVRYTGVNIGFGAGAATAGLIVGTGQPVSFLVLFLAQACLSAVYAMIVNFIPQQALVTQARSLTAPTVGARRPQLRCLLKDRPFWNLWLAALLFYTVGVAQLPTGFTLYATQSGQIGTQALGLALGLNSLSIVLLQFPVLRGMAGRLRTRALALLFLIWLGAWAGIALAGQHTSVFPPAVLFCLGACLLGSGETLMAPTLFPLAISLSPEAMQGTYAATISLASTSGFVLAPLVSGLLLGSGHQVLFPLVMMAGCIIGAGLARLLERQLSLASNLVSEHPASNT